MEFMHLHDFVSVLLSAVTSNNWQKEERSQKYKVPSNLNDQWLCRGINSSAI